MTPAAAIVAALVLMIAIGRLLRHLAGRLGRRLTGRSTDMPSTPVPAVVPRPSFPARIYHWRWEILAVTLLPYGLVRFAMWAGPAWSAAAGAAIVAVAVLRRRQVRTRLRAIRLQHRLRAVFALLRIPGGRPMILWTRPRGGDILISLFCREAFDHLHRHRALLAEACAVPEVYVDRHPSFASLVTLTISPTAAKREPGRTQLPSNVVPLRAHS